MAVSLERQNGLLTFFTWIWNELDRTIFTAIKFSFPSRFVSPFGFLGMLTFIMFVTLGLTGALLMFYYEPIMTRSWDSVAVYQRRSTIWISYQKSSLSRFKCNGYVGHSSYVLSVL